MPRVRNLATGLEWDVPAGHYALSSSEYVVLPDRKPEPAPVASEEPVKKPVARKSARKE